MNYRSEAVNEHALDADGLQVGVNYTTAQPKALAHYVQMIINFVIHIWIVLHAIHLGDVLAIVSRLEPVDETLRAEWDYGRIDDLHGLVLSHPADGDAGRLTGIYRHVVVNTHGAYTTRALAKITRLAILLAEIIAIGADTESTIPAHARGSVNAQSQ